MEEKIMEVLKSIGMNKNEVLVYLDLISFKTSSALNIANRTKLHRANTYDALKKLVEKGFVSEVLEGEKRFFRALEFGKLISYLRQKEKEVEDVIPLIKNISNQEFHKEEVILSKGLFSLRNSLVVSLGSAKIIEIYGIPENFLELIGEGFFREFNKQRIKNKIPLRLIFKQKPKEFKELNKSPLTEVRFSGLSYNSLTLIAVFDEEIMMIVPMNPISIITIKSKEIAEAYREYFKILWRYSKK